MKFLRDMMGRGPAVQGTAAMAADYATYEEPDVPEWDEDVDEADEWDFEPARDPSPRPVAAAAHARAAPVEPDADEAEADEPETEADETDERDSESLKIWELFDDEDETTEDADEEDADPLSAEAQTHADLAREALAIIKGRKLDLPGQKRNKPAPAAPAAPGAIPGGRAKTRLIGFAAGESGDDPFDAKNRVAASAPKMFPVGWIVVIEGPGRGASFPLVAGLSQIGRAEDQTISLAFGDQAISRENHASIAYDEEANAFYLGHGGKANIVRLNGRPVLSTEDLGNGDLIRIGETTLRFVALCGPDFAWDLTEDGEA